VVKQTEGLLASVVLLLLRAIVLPLLDRRFPVGLFHDRGQQEAHRYRASIHLVFNVNSV
jgi:hypothetical protein